jgi:hypothetical protein
MREDGLDAELRRTDVLVGVTEEDVVSPSRSEKPYSAADRLLDVTPVQKDEYREREECQRWPDQKSKDRDRCENEYQPRIDVRKTPSDEEEVLVKVQRVPS